MSTAKLIILDRDGVINFDSDAYIKSVQEWQIIPGSADAIARLCQADYKVAVATNQSGLARGYFSEQVLKQMHEKMRALVNTAGGEIAMIQYCPHHPDDGCDCRKPKIGMLEKISQQLQLDLKHVPFIGDSISDIKAAQSAGCTPYLVLTGKGQRTLEKHSDSLRDIKKFKDLAAAVNFILKQ